MEATGLVDWRWRKISQGTEKGTAVIVSAVYSETSEKVILHPKNSE